MIKQIGDCFHANCGICTYGKYQNYPCPYNRLNQCPGYIALTEKMIESWNKCGYIKINTNL